MSKKPQPEQTTITIRLDKDLAKVFGDIAKDNNRNKSILVRDWIEEYVRKNGQGKFNF